MSVFGFDSIGDMFDGGGPGASASNSGNNSSSGGGYVNTDRISSQRPTARGETPNYGQTGTHVSGPTHANTVEVGVGTNAFGTPQYGASERGARTAADDKNKDGYSDFFDAHPSSSIGPADAQTRSVAARVFGNLVSPAIGLGINTITRMQVAGILPGEGTPSTSGDTAEEVPANPELDGAVNAILDDESLSESEKFEAVKEILLPEFSPQEIQEMADQVYGEENTPLQTMQNPNEVMGNNRVQNLLSLLDANARGTNLDPANPNYALSDVSVTPTIGSTATVDNVDLKQALWYEADTSIDDVIAQEDTAAQGTVSDQSLVDPDAVGADMQGAATGVNEDGSVNHLGEALNQYASQGIATVIDTSTASGKILAQTLGEGNYTDAKATMQGQLEILSREFVDANGNPKIPAWAAGTARNVAKIAAFSGMTGTAAVAAMSTALMEASLPIAQADAAFFQTVTLENLGNRQQMTINKANVLANLNLADMDARMNAAVTNAQTFMQMDLANLQNDQQMRIVNTQARVQTILEDSKAVNAARLFAAESQNDFTKFYDNLNVSIDTFVAEQKNAMERFNVGEINDASEFNAAMERQRDTFESEMAYNIDLANARWRQEVQTTNSELIFRAAQTDVQNMVNISTEAMNRMWDREDSILAYTWKSGESQMDREVQRYSADRNYDLQERQIQNDEDAAQGAAWYEAINSGVSLFKEANSIFSWF